MSNQSNQTRCSLIDAAVASATLLAIIVGIAVLASCTRAAAHPTHAPTYRGCELRHGALNACDDFTGPARSLRVTLAPRQSVTWLRRCPLIDPRVNGSRGQWREQRTLVVWLNATWPWHVAFDGVTFFNRSHRTVRVTAHC